MEPYRLMQIFVAMQILLLVATQMLFSFALIPQDLTVQAHYLSKTNVNFDTDNPEVPDNIKKTVKELLENHFEKTSILLIDGVASLYKFDRQPEFSSTGHVPLLREFLSSPEVSYKNIETRKYVKQTELFGKTFLIKDSLLTYDWKITGEKKMIGDYNCFKAIGRKAVDSLDFSNIKWKVKNEDSNGATERIFSNFEVPESAEITVWFTPDIPTTHGPGQYYGLPGLILQVNSGRTVTTCTKIIIGPKIDDSVVPPKKGKKVTQAEFDKIRLNKMEAIREQYIQKGAAGKIFRNF